MKERIKQGIAIALSVALLLSVTVFFTLRSDVGFWIEQTLDVPPSMDLTPLSESPKGRTWSIEELCAAEKVSASALMMLVNATHPLPKEYEPTLTEYNGAQMHPLMVDAYVALRDEVLRRTGVRIYVSSDYRTAEEQKEILNESAAGTAAPLGCSEHEAGVALDVYAPYYAGQEFLKSPAGREVNRICGDYGFVIRYAREKEAITGILYEPWHLRYVGAPHAALMMEQGLVLEEYMELFAPEVWYKSGEYLILRTAKREITLPQEWESAHISPDNTGYTFITIKIS